MRFCAVRQVVEQGGGGNQLPGIGLAGLLELQGLQLGFQLGRVFSSRRAVRTSSRCLSTTSRGRLREASCDWAVTSSLPETNGLLVDVCDQALATLIEAADESSLGLSRVCFWRSSASRVCN